MIASKIILKGIFFLLLPFAFSQDQLFYESILNNHKKVDQVEEKNQQDEKEEVYYWKAETMAYAIDLNSDRIDERIIYQKKDGANNIIIENNFKKEIKRFTFDSNHLSSKLIKINVRNISNRHKILVFYFDEGRLQYLNLHHSIRVYFLTIDDKNLQKIFWYKGPLLWEKMKRSNGDLTQKSYELDFIDLDNNNNYEIRYAHGESNKLSTIYFYRGNGIFVVR